MSVEDYIDLNAYEDEEYSRMDEDAGTCVEDVKAIAETPKALLLSRKGAQVWVPKGQIAGGDVHKKGDKGTIYLPGWLLERVNQELDAEPEGVDLDGEWMCLKESDKAILVEDPQGGEQWIPKSQIVGGSEVTGDGDSGTLKVTQWWAEQKMGVQREDEYHVAGDDLEGDILDDDIPF